MLLAGAHVSEELEVVRLVVSGVRASGRLANQRVARSRFAARYAASHPTTNSENNSLRSWYGAHGGALVPSVPGEHPFCTPPRPAHRAPTSGGAPPTATAFPEYAISPESRTHRQLGGPAARLSASGMGLAA
jgi:hypothetical protein